MGLTKATPREANIMWAAVLIVLAVAIGWRLYGPKPTPVLSDADKATAMQSNIAALNSTESWYPVLLTDGKHLDLSVSGTVLFVATTLAPAATGTAASICSTIAAETNDPETAQPLGITLVQILSGGGKIAECRP